ncbi:gliding motility lipoprotein GldH [Salibacteraceae bacterium]|nr:gliding motility lipoprotein GldH [Flavobacteriales bacterium]MDC1202524.1 gliding motility lipoprotein GldH [Salibacteraceae bacterium]
MRVRLAVICVSILGLMGCESDALINETKEIIGSTWAYDQPVSFTTEVSDTLATHNFYIQLRHGGDYKYQNLIVFFRTYYPNNTFITDTVDCPLAETDGKWKGSGLGDILDNRIVFKINQTFPQAGTYNLELQHGMRSDSIHEIYDVGLLVHQTNN